MSGTRKITIKIAKIISKIVPVVFDSFSIGPSLLLDSLSPESPPFSTALNSVLLPLTASGVGAS